jgi:hypothetical protein
MSIPISWVVIRSVSWAIEYALEHFFSIRYVEWAGELWTVVEVEDPAPPPYPPFGGGVQWTNGCIAPRHYLELISPHVYFQPPPNMSNLSIPVSSIRVTVV